MRCSTSKSSVGCLLRTGKDVIDLALAAKSSGFQIGRKNWDAVSHTKQSKVASDATSDDEYTGPGLKCSCQ